MIYNVNLLKGVNGMEFGFSFHDVRNNIKGDFISYNPAAVMEKFKEDFPTDYYEDLGVFCYYDKEGHLEAMAFMSPSRPMLAGVDILSLTMGQAIALFKRLDPDLEADEEEATSYRLSVGFRSADPDEGYDASVDSILVGRPGYYDLSD